ncbi:MAG: hypothetical protein K0R46_2555 [Herbinix sp.]|nr:hypothetical protein [Herbinix sp.]
MENIKQTITEVLKNIELTAESFYQQKQNEGYQGLVPIIDSLIVITEFMSGVEQTSELSEHNILIKNALQDASEAIANKDGVLLADILKYDISDALKHLLEIEL